MFKSLSASASAILLSGFFAFDALAQRTNPPTTTTTGTTTGGSVSSGLDKIKAIFPPIFGKQDWTLITVIEAVLQIALWFAFLLCVIFIVIGGYRYITAQGNDTQSTEGRKTLQNALIGLAIVFMSYALVQILFNFLTTSTT